MNCALLPVIISIDFSSGMDVKKRAVLLVVVRQEHEKRDLDLRLAPVAVKLQLLRVDAAAVDHHEIGGSAVADVAAAAFGFHKHVVPGRLAQRVDRIVRHSGQNEEHIPVKSRRMELFTSPRAGRTTDDGFATLKWQGGLGGDTVVICRPC